VAATVPQRTVNGSRSLSPIAVGLYQYFKRAQTRVELLALRKAGELR
jgi:hypothetical protein